MIYLIQLYNLVGQRKLFIQIFSGLKEEAKELGYEGFETELVNEMLYNHFGLELESDKQLEMLTDAMLKRDDLSFLEAFRR